MTSGERPSQGHEVGGPLPRGRPQPLADLRQAPRRGSLRRRGDPASPARRLAALDAGRESLDDFVTQTWAPTYAVTLAPKTRQHYANLYDCHISPSLGGLACAS